MNVRLVLYIVLLLLVSFCKKQSPTGGVYVANQAPKVTISQPQNGLTLTRWESVTFAGSVIDPEDGILPDSSLVWISNIDDTLGFGGTLESDLLSEGPHVISLISHDSESLAGEDNILLYVVPNPRVTKITSQPGVGWHDWSSDGQWIVYAQYPDGGIAKKHPALLSSPDTLLRTESFWNLRFSPDGSKIAFNTVSPDHRIGIMRSDGTGFRILTSSNIESYGSVWSPDGNELAYILTEDKERQLRKLNISNPEEDTLIATFDLDLRIFPDWSWALDLIVLEYKGFFWTINPDGTNLTQIFDSYAQNTSNTFRVSPDGTMIAFEDAPDIWVVELSTGTRKRVTVHSRHDFGPAWSPDGSQIAFLSDRSGRRGVWDIWVVPFP